MNKIARLCQIKVIRRGGRLRMKGRQRRKTNLTQLGNRTWLIGVRELVRDPASDEQRMIDKAEKTLRQRLNDPDEELYWIRWSGKSRFVRECREGDSLIEIWRSSGAKRPSVVLAPSLSY